MIDTMCKEIDNRIKSILINNDTKELFINHVLIGKVIKQTKVGESHVVKYKSISDNKYLNGTIQTITFTQ